MSFPKDDDELDAALSEAFTPPPAADFAAWQRQHSEAVACLNPQQMRQILRERNPHTKTDHLENDHDS